MFIEARVNGWSNHDYLKIVPCFSISLRTFPCRLDVNVAVAIAVPVAVAVAAVTSALAVPVIRTVPGRSTGTGGAVTKIGPAGPGTIGPARTSRRVGPCLGPLFGRRPAPNSR